MCTAQKMSLVSTSRPKHSRSNIVRYSAAEPSAVTLESREDGNGKSEEIGWTMDSVLCWLEVQHAGDGTTLCTINKVYKCL
jgi:hypothetical protein